MRCAVPLLLLLIDLLLLFSIILKCRVYHHHLNTDSCIVVLSTRSECVCVCTGAQSDVSFFCHILNYMVILWNWKVVANILWIFILDHIIQAKQRSNIQVFSAFSISFPYSFSVMYYSLNIGWVRLQIRVAKTRYGHRTVAKTVRTCSITCFSVPFQKWPMINGHRSRSQKCFYVRICITKK